MVFNKENYPTGTWDTLTEKFLNVDEEYDVFAIRANNIHRKGLLRGGGASMHVTRYGDNKNMIEVSIYFRENLSKFDGLFSFCGAEYAYSQF